VTARLPDAEPQNPGEPGRIVLLLALLATVSLWLQHHLGFELKKLGIVALVGVVWGAMGKLADWFGVKSAVGAFFDSYVRAPLRGVLRHAVRTGPLRFISATLAVLMAILSSVTVRSELADERGAVSIMPADADGKASVDSLRPGGLVRFLPVITTPFGREFRVDADGYLPASVTVYPLISRRVVLGRDLAAIPSVLFRPFEEGAIGMLDGGLFRVSRLRGATTEVLATDSGHAASFLLGRPRAVTEAMMGLWGLELDAVPVKPEPKAQLLMLWRRPRQLTTGHRLAPNDRLVAEILVRGRVKARAEVTLSGGPLIDVLMQDVTAEAGEVPPC
jgi:hypothetical protein